MESRRWQRGGITVVELCGSPEELGLAHGRLLADRVRRACGELIHQRVLPGVAAELFPDQPGEQARFPAWCAKQARVLCRQIADAYRAEIRGLAKGAGLEEDQVMFAQVLLDVLEQVGLTHAPAHFHACTQLAVLPERAGGHTLVARNLDWPPFGLVQELGVLFHILPDQGIPFWAMGWAGTVGTLTGLNHQGLCVTEESLTVTGDVSLNGVPTFLLHRDLLQQEDRLDGAIQRLCSSPRTNGYHTLIASGQQASARVVLHSASASAVRAAHGGLCPGVDLERSPERYDDGRLPPAQVPLTDDSSDFRYGRLNELLQAHQGPVSPQDLRGWLADDLDIQTGQPGTGLNCLANETTLQSLVADLSTGRFSVAMGSIPAPQGGFVDFDLEDPGEGGQRG